MAETMQIGRKAVIVTDQDIDDIMVAALEGGITYWCHKVEVVGEYLGEYASEQISHGGSLKLYGSDKINGDSRWPLNREKFLEGLKKFLKEEGEGYECFYREDDKYSLECAYIDAGAADIIIQNAVFGKQVYG